MPILQIKNSISLIFFTNSKVFELCDFIFEKYATNNDDEEYKYIEELREFFVSNDTSIKIGNKYLRENLQFKDEKYKKVDVENPNEFIKKLFGEE